MWTPIGDVSKRKAVVAVVSGSLVPLFIGVYLIMIGMGLEALPFLVISLSPVIGGARDVKAY
ncbi:hypothetical protein CHITON_0085 [Thermococcus chitonophagus]|nr:hypothetical protein CHITON_0085 [Thermococcus chitonophagus]